ncbi:hypothetical protein [Haladaptatus sp. R4]|uniref:hypothetical protein n=1 Tax=Haladaptatus sp. R4 TaxID=1679489 RepID=UPI001237894C|nr:hypothetical protein [Haladaptatus sp. R4]
MADDTADKYRQEAENRDMSVSSLLREKLNHYETIHRENEGNTNEDRKLREEREEFLKQAERLRGELNRTQDLLDEKDERIEELQADKQTLNVRLSEAQKAQRHANSTRKQTELQPVQQTDEEFSGLLGRLLGR